MIKVNSLFLLPLILALLFASNSIAAEYEVRWEVPTKNLSFELYKMPFQYLAQHAESGPLTKLQYLKDGEKIVDGKVTVPSGEAQSLMLVVKNNTNKVIRFLAVPHHIDPIESSIDFKFRCLCIGHFFPVPAKGLWYRIMTLKEHNKNLEKSKIILTHKILIK